MRRTLGIMFTWTTYGKWLRGDARGWVRDGIVFPPDPVLEDRDRERLLHPPFAFPKDQRFRAGELVGEGARSIGAAIHALHIGSWQLHVLIGYVPLPVPKIVKTLKDRVRRGLGHRRPIWVTGYDHRFCFDASSMRNRITYIRTHNAEDRLPPDPWAFIVPWEG